MKHIIKQDEPQKFIDWKALANDDWQPSYDNLSGPPKQAIKTSLMQEQGYLCCYCERRLTDDDSHIEHFRPQTMHGVDPLDFGNMLCSCQKILEKGEPRHCGNHKGDWFDAILTVSPLDPACEGRFHFTGQGRIFPANPGDLSAATTITKLALDHPKLDDMRSKAIEPFLDATLTEHDLRTFVTGYLTKDAEGKFGEFWSTIRHIFGGFVTA
jgi:uncharacterized protein (TIGR02646 family)